MLHKTLWSLCLLLTFPRSAVCWPKLCFSFILSKCHPEAKKSQSSWIKASSLPLYWVCGSFKGFLVFQKDPCVVFSLICGLDEKQLPRISLYTQLTSLLRIIRRKEQRSYSSSFLFMLQLAAILQNHSVLIPCWWTFQSRNWILTQHKLMEKEHFLDLDAFTFFCSEHLQEVLTLQAEHCTKAIISFSQYPEHGCAKESWILFKDGLRVASGKSNRLFQHPALFSD